MKKGALFLFLLLTLMLANAQSPALVKSQMLKDWQRAKEYTKEYLDAMPADKYSFKAQDSIRSFAQQMLHLAAANNGLGANGTGQSRLWPGRNLEATASAQSKDSVTYFVMASYDFIINGINTMDWGRIEDKVKAGSLEETRYAWLLKAFEHQTHHRGQTTIYIRLVGIKPPNEKLF